MKKKIRVIQYGVGPIGAGLVRLMREKQALELVGAIDTDPAKAGRDLGELVGAADAPWGVPVTSDAEGMLQEAVDVVIHSTSSYLPDVVGQLMACLAAESCVVSTCEELSYPFRKHPQLAAKIDAEAKTWGVAITGTGVNPGFAMDKLALTLGASARRIDRARVMRVVNAATRREPLQRKVGAGMTVEEFREKVAAGIIKHHGLPESVAMVADGLGLEVSEITESIEPVIARETVRTEFLEVPAGRVAGVHQIARGRTDGKEQIFMELKMYVGAERAARHRRTVRRSGYRDDRAWRNSRRHQHRGCGGEYDSRDPRRARGAADFTRSAGVLFRTYCQTLITRFSRFRSQPEFFPNDGLWRRNPHLRGHS